MDFDLARYVGEDLDYLFDEWNQDISEASLRRSSPILRSLLVENKLSLVSKFLGLDLKILAPDITRSITDQKFKEYIYWQAGGAIYNGTQIRSAFILGRSMTDLEISQLANDASKSLKNSPVKVQVFLRQPSFVVEGNFINREEVIKYVANKLGGAHYDDMRKPSAGRDISLDDKYILLDKVRSGKIMTGGKDAIYHELLSVGQRLINSRDVRILRKRLRGYVSSSSIIYA
jgi:hypothetical protein